ncbi:MAG: 50S ribosomal protein L21 [Duodenibacillus sp.]|nr:50S ribosomal protein L21 [Duodenibacillus sp.]
MYAIIKTGGKQYRVAVDDLLKIETIEAGENGEVTFEQVLAVSTEEGLKVGTPVVEGAKVVATVVGTGRHDKVRIFKFRRRKHSMKSGGHRQNYTEVKITQIVA